MPAADSTALLLRFGAFELDLHNNELRRAGVLLKLSPQQFQVLRLLAENSGQVQSREDIQREVWGKDTFVDFDRNLNVCIAQIRATLNDDSDSPRFIQTLPKRGYRFIAPVERVPGPEITSPARPSPIRPRMVWVEAAMAAGVLIAIVFAIWHPFSRPTRTMLATLPFENLTDDPKEDPFTDGLTEEVISQLGSLDPRRLGVIGRSSVMRYKHAPHGIDQVGRELHVDYVVEGTVRRSDGRIRIATRLIKVADQAQVWNQTVERAEAELFRVEEESAARIVDAVSAKLIDRKAPPKAVRARNEEAFQAYLNGRYLVYKHNRADLERGIAYYEEAVKLDGQFDEAYSATAEALVAMGRSGNSPASVWTRARAAAEKALSINDANSEAHNALANVAFWSEWNWTLAEQQFTRALAINSSMPAAHHDYAFFLVAMGRTEPGISALKRAIVLDPLSARINIDAGWLYLQAHHFDEAIRQARRAQELEPGLAEANACILRSLLYQRKFAEIAAMLHLPAGDPEAALKSLYRQKLAEDEKSGAGDLFQRAARYAFLGEKSRALDALEKAYAGRNIQMALLKTEPSFTVLHDDPRFQELARKLGL